MSSKKRRFARSAAVLAVAFSLLTGYMFVYEPDHANVYLSSFNPFVLRRLKQIDPNVRTVFIFRDIEPNDPTQFAKIPFFLKNEFCRRAIRKIIQPDLLSVETTVDKKTIQNLQAKGYPIILWTPNSEAEVQECFETKPFAIITDEPLVAMSAMTRP